MNCYTYKSGEQKMIAVIVHLKLKYLKAKKMINLMFILVMKICNKKNCRRFKYIYYKRTFKMQFLTLIFHFY